MPTALTGNPASGARSPAISGSGPAAADLVASGTIDTLFQKILDYIAWLQANTPGLAEGNTFTQAQVMQALLTLSASDVALSKTGAQKMTKTGTGGLTVGTEAGNGDLILTANGVSMFKALAAGTLDAQGKRLANLAAPTTAGDAVAWVAPAWTALVGLGDFSILNSAAYIKDIAGVVHFRGGFGSTAGGSFRLNNATIAAGCRPANQITYVIKAGAGTANVVVDSAGVMTLAVAAPAGTTFDIGGISYYAEV